MNWKFFFSIAITVFFIQNLPAQQKEIISIIPQPVKVEKTEGAFTFSEQTKICFNPDDEIKKLGDLIAEHVNTLTRLKLYTTSLSTNEIPYGSVGILIQKDFKYKEGYTLSVKPNEIRIIAENGAGVFYAIQSLLQLFPTELKGSLSVPCVEIEDHPRFAWRGVHLDVCRHFFPVEFIKKYIDILAMYKINTFHWHLTEDQGWRIEIKKYPELTGVGAWRKETMGDGTPYGGFYTQDQIREVVEYAKQRYVTIVPEIEMPGHALAALSAYPELSCTGGPFEVGTTWGVFKDVYCAGNDNVFDFLENVLTEIVALFPSEFIHIGGDEVPKDRWKVCPTCQARTTAEGLNDENELQSYFIHRIEKFLNSRGKKIIGWDEILEGGLAKNAAVMSWRGTEGGIAAAKLKHNVVMSPATHCYFDYYQGLSGEPEAIGGYTPLEKVYSYEPIPTELSDTKAQYIMGAQANMWSEYFETTDHVEYMLLPRLCALSEVVWSPKELRNTDEFQKRMIKHYEILFNKNFNFRIPPPISENGELLITANESITLFSPILKSTIRYTLDGLEPHETSEIYSKPLAFSNPALLKVKTFLPNGRSSITSTLQISVVDTTENGLFYKYYEGNWDSLPKFNQMRPEKTGKIHKLSLSEIDNSEDYFGFELIGFINIEKEGTYIFYLTSDDGSKLIIDNKEIINNDGFHSRKEMSSAIKLDSGKYPFRILFFEKSGGQELKLEYEGPGIAKKPVPASALFFDN